MNKTTKSIVYAAALLAICLVSQVFKNLSVYITGPIINACLILCVMTAGPVYAVALAVITPITAYFISGSPIMSAIPAIMPCVMVGNAILVLGVYLLKDRIKKPAGFPVSMVVGSVLKAAFMGVVISLILIPTMLPASKMAEKLMPKMAVFQTTFSVTQLITALIGSALAFVLWIPVSKTINK